MEVSLSLINKINEEKTYHRFLELDLSKEKLQEFLKKSLVNTSTQLFRTKKARALLTQITTKIKSFATTPYSKLLVNTLLPTQNIKEIQRRQKLCFKATNLDVPLEIFKELVVRVSNIKYNSIKKHNGICIAFADEELYMQLRSILSKKYYVTLVESEQDLISIDHYEHIRFVKKTNSSLVRSAETMPQVTIVDSQEIIDISPEFITDILDEYKDSIAALKELEQYFSFSHILPSIIETTKRRSFKLVETEMQTLFSEFQDELSKIISQSNFSGQQLIKIMNNQQSILDYLNKESANLIREKKQILQKRIEELTQLSCLELFRISSLGELEIDNKQMNRLEKEYYAQQEDSLYSRKVQLSKEWQTTIKILPLVVEEVYQYDLLMALKQFIDEYDLSKPEFIDQGISFLYGKNMNILGATPIEYHVGITDQVAIITGANSGGKTTLLELLGQIQILSHMGLYVPAKETKVGLVDEIYYFSKNKGSLNAGAFETLLKQFSGISDDNSKKLILADEIESVTEPDVAAKIIQGIILHLRATKNNTLVLVTHMGRELEELRVKGRFDGIEAKGLDKDLNLVVDRNPVIGRIARSTPQLIIERLAKLHKSPFYDALKELIV